MSDELVLYEDCGGYGIVTLNRPEKRNAVNGAVQHRLRQVLRESIGRHGVMILTGNGAAFCEGADPDDQRAASQSGAAPADHSRQGDGWSETVEAIRKHPAAFIAAVNGTALGGGMALINVCDLAIAAEEAEIGMPEITSDSYPTIAGPTTQLRILRKHASWLILTGKRIDARTAERWGLVNAVFPRDRLMAEARAVAERMAAFNPTTVDWSRKALDDIPSQVSDWTAALEYGRMITSVIQNRIGKDKVTPAKF